MSDLDSWEQFELTGTVEDYLRYEGLLRKKTKGKGGKQKRMQELITVTGLVLAAYLRGIMTEGQ
ncbi:MAG: hypothetical protein V8Q27_01795 [Eubacteriales bacterium]